MKYLILILHSKKRKSSNESWGPVPVILGSIATMGWNSFKKAVNLINQ